MAGTVYGKYLAVDLARMAMKGLLTKTALDPATIDYLYYGSVIQETKTSNIAREASLNCGIPLTVPSHTVTQACISANQAITAGKHSSPCLFVPHLSAMTLLTLT